MKNFLVFIGFILIILLGGAVNYFLSTEAHVRRWEDKVQSAQRYREDMKAFTSMRMHTEKLSEAVRMLSSENGLLCEREHKMVKVVNEYEMENRRLKGSLKEAVENLQKQIEENNQLMEEVDRLRYRVDTLERALDAVETNQKDESTAVPPLPAPGPAAAAAVSFIFPFLI